MPRIDGRRLRHHARIRTPRFTIGYAGHLYPWKGVDLVIEAVAALTDTRGLIIGGHEQEPDLARVKALADAAELRVAGHVHGTDSAGGGGGAAARGGRADAAEPEVGDLERVHVTA